ncbi:MAG: trigger factor [Candidatus Omnitrophica bacterium]|nr:trigger factor [Candidatus Omnitrophota bacterium]
MKLEVKKLDATKRELNIEVSGDIVKNKFEDVFARIAKEAKVPGFRPGNAPRDILEKKFSGAAQEQVLRELIPDVYGEAVKKESLDVIEMPEITDVKLEGHNLTFKATVEVSPQINIKDYKGIKINYQRVSVGPDEVKRNLDSLKESRKLESLDDAFARGLGYPDLSELEKAIERQLFLQKEKLQRQQIEDSIIEGLTKDLDFKIPQSLINRQLQDLIRQAKVDLALRGLPREKIDQQDEALSKELAPQAKKQVQVYLILAEVAKKENIPLDEQMPHKVMELLMREAKWEEKK